MAGHNYLPTSKQIWAPGPVDVKYGPFNSINEFKAWYEGELGELYRGITVGIIQQDGTIKEYWNGNSESVNDFVVKAQIPQLADVATSGNYDDLNNKPTIPVVNDSEIVFTHDGKEVGRMTTNQSAGKTIEVGEGEERVFTAAFLKKVLTCRMNKEVYMTSKDIVSPNMLKFNAFAEPGSSSTAWCGAGTEPTAGESTRIIIHNVNVDSWKGRTMTFTIKEGMEFAIASGTVTQSLQWDKSYPQTSDIPWNWHNHNDPVTIEIKDMISIMIRNAGNGTFNWEFAYQAMWEWLEIEEVPTQQSRDIAPKKLKDDRYAGSRVGVLGDSILAGASTRAYKTALDVLVSDYGIVPVPRCIAGSCIAPTSAAYSRDDIRFKNRIEINWQYTSTGYNGAENGANRPFDKSLGVLIFGVNDVLMDKEALDTEPFIRVTDSQTGCQEWQINTPGLNADGYLAALIELESLIKTGAGTTLNHIYLVGPYECMWPGAYPMSTTGINPNGNTGEDYIKVQRQLAMIKGWSYLDILASQLNTKYTAMSNDSLHPSQEGHQILGDLLGQMLCGTILTQAAPIFKDEENENEGIETPIQLDYKEGYNLFDFSNVERGKGLNPNTGEITEDSQSILSNLIVIPPAGERGATGNLHFFNLPVTTASKRFVQLDSEMNIVRGPSDITASDTTAEIGIHSDAKYLLFTLVRAMSTLPTEQELQTMYEDTVVTVHHTMSDPQPYYRNVESIDGVGLCASSISNLYKGKKWVCVGDSLTERNNHSTKFYHDFIKEWLGFDVINMGVSGTGYKTRDDVQSPATEGAFYQRIPSIPSDADVVTIFGSFNDMTQNHTLGTPSDTGTTTICGCINAAISAVYAINPAMKLGIIAPCPWKEMNPSNPDAVAYVEALQDICMRNSIPFLNLFYESGLRPWERAVRDLVYDRDAQTGGDYHGTHPNELGHQMIASKMKTFIMSLI